MFVIDKIINYITDELNIEITEKTFYLYENEILK